MDYSNLTPVKFQKPLNDLVAAVDNIDSNVTSGTNSIEQILRNIDNSIAAQNKLLYEMLQVLKKR